MPHLEGAHEIEGRRVWDGDPKPFLADRAYDATQHLMNCKGRMLIAPTSTIRRFADLLEVDDGRVRLWMFARLATELDDMSPDDDVTLARALW